MDLTPYKEIVSRPAPLTAGEGGKLLAEIERLQGELERAKTKIVRRDATIKQLRKEVKRAWEAGQYEASH